MELMRDMHSDLATSGPSINFSRRVKSLITAMNSRTPVNNLKPGNDMRKVQFIFKSLSVVYYCSNLVIHILKDILIVK